MLFWHLLHNPDVMQRVSRELDENLPRMTAHHDPFSVADVERQLPYLRSCIKENFRITPAFTMPLPRRVTNDETFLNGERIPKGVSQPPPFVFSGPKAWACFGKNTQR